MAKETNFDPARLERIRKNGKTLQDWFNSMSEQRGGWDYPRGVEVNAHDALEATYRIASSFVALCDDLAGIFAAHGMSAGTDKRPKPDGEKPQALSAKHEGAVGAADGPNKGRG